MLIFDDKKTMRLNYSPLPAIQLL